MESKWEQGWGGARLRHGEARGAGRCPVQLPVPCPPAPAPAHEAALQEVGQGRAQGSEELGGPGWGRGLGRQVFTGH